LPKVVIPFSAFLEKAGDEHLEFINKIHDYMTENQCTTEIKEAANGYVVSYKHKPSKRTVMNYVFRKKGLLMRIYADNVLSYADFLSTLPESMKKELKKGGTCKRLVDPEACSIRCLVGYDFIFDGQRYQQCRYSSFMLLLTDESKPYLKEMLELEMNARIEAMV
jgi:hypothetical protein